MDIWQVIDKDVKTDQNSILQSKHTEYTREIRDVVWYIAGHKLYRWKYWQVQILWIYLLLSVFPVYKVTTNHQSTTKTTEHEKRN